MLFAITLPKAFIGDDYRCCDEDDGGLAIERV